MADYILDKGFPVLSTYNGSNVAGVTAFRVVKLTTTGIDLCTDAVAATAALGVVQENVDQVKVATGKVNAGVRLLGSSKVYVNAGAGAITVGTRVMCGNAGGVVPAATTGSRVLGVVIGGTTLAGTISPGDIIDVLLTPGAQF
jgi:hypothetical protein